VKKNYYESDILVIGTGISGLSSAIYAAEAGFKVNLLTKSSKVSETNTDLAQGGIIYPEDDYQALIDDIIAAGDGLSYYPAVEVLAKEGAKYVNDLLIDKAKINFTRAEDGSLDFTAEAAHSRRRIVHSADTTGNAIEKGLLELIKKYNNIKILKNHIVVDLISRQHNSKDVMAIYEKPEVIGAYVYDINNEKMKYFFAKAVILANGGLGQIYKHTTNSNVATGDGYSIADRIGAMLINMEYTQFHPTIFYSKKRKGFLITEAMRGEGGILKLSNGKEFMKKYHPLGSLAPRDVVARAIHNELIKSDQSCVYLDIYSYMNAKEIKKHFPTIYKTCKKYGTDITKEPIPVVPAFHYMCGGVKVDLWGRTNIKRLFAVGEVSCTGVHGANRLASTSLLEGLVWSARSIEYIKKNKKYYDTFKVPEIIEWENFDIKPEPDNAVINKAWSSLQNIMWNYVGLERSKERLKIALNELRDLQDSIEEIFLNYKMTRDIIELRNGVNSALIITKSAWQNKESRGTHYRIN